MNHDKIAYCKIHPSIGIARVGGSTTAYCLGPEVPGEDRSEPRVRAMKPNDPPPATNGYKDESGLLLRQAARFRIYAYDADGAVLGEIAPGDGVDVEWNVHIANTKAAWYNFDLAMDIPEYNQQPTPSALRNAKIDERSKLIIDPGPRSIRGRNAHGVVFDGGKFFDKDVSLGELQTDEEGRLIVLGGVGDSASYNSQQATTFANNDGWHDDVGDGPVQATVTIGGRNIDVEHAWVVVAPPDYAPGLIAVVTFYDIIRDLFWQEDPAAWMPQRLSFQRDLLPIFDRLVQNQWVNAGFGQDFGYMREAMRTFADNTNTITPTNRAQAARVMVFQQFRNPDYATQEALAIPPVYGDDMNLPATDSPRQWMALTKMQYEMLRQWSLGNFDSDYEPDARARQYVEEYPIAEQPHILDFASLDNTIGGPFHPGCEMTWPMRQRIVYDAPFRIKLRKSPEPDYGPTLDQGTALGKGGPLDGSLPGSISRWMAVPWQTDTSSCLYAYELWGTPGIYLPTFWPVRVPNSVLTEEAYAAILDTSLPMAERQVAFSYERRPFWLRALPAPGNPLRNAFVKQFNEVGVITQQPGPKDALFPSPMHVELGMNVRTPNVVMMAMTVEEATPEAVALPHPREER